MRAKQELLNSMRQPAAVVLVKVCHFPGPRSKELDGQLALTQVWNPVCNFADTCASSVHPCTKEGAVEQMSKQRHE